MTSRSLTFTVRTPEAVVVEQPATSVRVPTETGQVGLRPGVEPTILVVEPGLIVVRAGTDMKFVGCAGGLLDVAPESIALLTPFAVAGSSPDDVLATLDSRLAAPDSELLARKRLGELETTILAELKLRKGVRDSKVRAT